MKPVASVSKALLIIAVAVAFLAALLFEGSSARARPDVTAVLLNWARLPNVVRIVSVLCGEQLSDILKEVVVWNNNYSRPLAYEDLAGSGCSSSQLRIHNSPDNVYFQARFMACANASTPYCFIQDDDYLVPAEIIRSLRARIAAEDIFFNPPDEALSSHLLSIDSPSTNITFAFSWLGYGSLILRKNAQAFLALLEQLGASEEEKKMADNYYSILRNRFPEIWIGHPIPLFGGGAFTVGAEGVARNRKHISAAAKYLDAIIALGDGQSPYVVSLPTPRQESERSPCVGRACVLESTIKSVVVDPSITDAYKTAGDVFAHETRLSKSLTEEITFNYINFPLFYAVDSDPETSFRSTRNAAAGDSLMLDMLADTNLTAKEWAWIVDSATVDVLKHSTFSFSRDKMTWVQCANMGSCSGQKDGAWKCAGRFELNSFGRYLRAELVESKGTPWHIYETWIA